MLLVTDKTLLAALESLCQEIAGPFSQCDIPVVVLLRACCAETPSQVEFYCLPRPKSAIRMSDKRLQRSLTMERESRFKPGPRYTLMSGSCRSRSSVKGLANVSAHHWEVMLQRRRLRKAKGSQPGQEEESQSMKPGRQGP